MACAKCKQELLSSQETVKCQDCNNEFHVSCCKQPPGVSTRKGSKKVNSWRCEVCAADLSSADRSDSEQRDSVIDILNKIREDMSDDRKENAAGFSTVNTNLNGIKDSVEKMESKLTKIEQDNITLTTECAYLRQENEKLLEHVCSLEGRVCELEQYSRNHNLKIKGIPLTHNENIIQILKSITEALGIEFSMDHISACHRLQAPRDRRPPAIVVQFVSRATRATWLAAAKQRKISTTDVSASLAPGKVFIFEHLTVANKLVLGHARSLVKVGRMAFAWTKDGKIFARKTPTSPAVRVWTRDDVDRVVAPAAAAGESTRVRTPSSRATVAS